MTKPLRDPTIKTVTGRYFDLVNPQLSAFDIQDIAHALSQICRFTGHTRQFYSVAQHSVIVSRIVPQADAMAGLMHDAAEAFIGDVSGPLKSLLPDYKAIERKVEAAIAARFGLPAKMPASVKAADIVALKTEQRDLMGAGGDIWTSTRSVEALPQVIEPISPRKAFYQFIDRFHELQLKGAV